MDEHADAPIGVFDSGVGGLTVTRALVDRLPSERLVYFGDTARVPYGNKSPETIRRYGLNIVEHLITAQVKAVVVACNTASAYSLEAIAQAHASLPVLGVIEPVARQAAQRSQTRHVGVIGTRGTIASGAYLRALASFAPDLKVHTTPCPLFVPLAEEGWLRGEVPLSVARTYLAAFAGTDIDTLILGCTHYPLLRDVIQEIIDEVVGRPVMVLDSATATAQTLDEILTERGLRSQTGARRAATTHRFLVTDAVDAFREVSSRFFGAPVVRVEHVDL